MGWGVIRHCVVCDGYDDMARMRWYRRVTNGKGRLILEAVDTGGLEPGVGLRGVCEDCRAVIAGGESGRKSDG